MRDYDQVRHEGVLAVIVGFLAVFGVLFSAIGAVAFGHTGGLLEGRATSLDVAAVLATAEDDPHIEFYKNGKEICDLKYAYYPDRQVHVFTFDQKMEPFRQGHYKVKEAEGTVEYHRQEYMDDENPTVYQIQEDPALYEALMEYIPKEYIKAHFVGDIKQTDMLGLFTVYTVETDGGEVSGRWSFVGGTPNKYIHYTSENTRLEIVW